MKKIFFLLVISVFVIYSCKKEDPVAEQLKEDIELIEAYLLDNGLVAESTESGLHYIIKKQGTGNYPKLSSIVEVGYTGKLLNGNVFDKGIVNNSPLYRYIKGWHEGIPLFKEGGKGTLFIPSELGYGSANKNKIPANSVLVFDIELISVYD